MKLLYATSITVPSALANRIQTLATAAALSKLLPGAFVLGLRSTTLPLPFPYAAFGSGWSPLLALRYARYIKTEGITHIYSREDRLLAFLILLTGNKLTYCFEAHTVPTTLAFSFLRWRKVRIVAISSGLKSDLMQFGISENCIAIAHDGVDLEQWKVMPSKDEARAVLGLSQDARIALYVGRLDGWKGLETFLGAAPLLAGVATVVIGGKEIQRTQLQIKHPSVQFLPARPYEDLPHSLAVADVLVLPNTAKEVISARHTSPLKLFAYMASLRPIVASDLPSIREVLDDASACFVTPDSPEALAQGIMRSLANQEEAFERAVKARAIVEHYTWDARARHILEFIG